jgi:hypothetical protein
VSNTTGWVAGRGQGLTPGAAFNSSDIASMPNGKAALSSVADIANQTYLDQFADVFAEIAISSATLAAGVGLVLYVFDKFEIDGSNNYYGDNSLAGTGGGTFASYLPSYKPIPSSGPTITGSAQTLVLCTFEQIILPPRAFRFALGNNLGVTLGSGTQYVSFVTYNQNLNA